MMIYQALLIAAGCQIFHEEHSVHLHVSLLLFATQGVVYSAGEVYGQAFFVVCL